MRFRRAGFTLIEILIGIAILGMLLVLLVSLVGNVSRSSRDTQNRMTATDTARRVIEMVSQEMRSSAFGILAQRPYVPNDRQISLLRPAAVAGNSVAGIGVVATPNFPTETFTTVYMGNLPALSPNVYMVLVGTTGARLMRTTAASGTGTTRTLQHNSCPNQLAAASATVSLVVPVGFRHDPASRTLFERRGDGQEVPLAWDVEQFNVRYVYANTTTNAEQVSATYDGPTRTVAGATWSIRRLELSLRMRVQGSVQSVNTTVNLASPIGLNLTSYSECVI